MWWIVSLIHDFVLYRKAKKNHSKDHTARRLESYFREIVLNMFFFRSTQTADIKHEQFVGQIFFRAFYANHFSSLINWGCLWQQSVFNLIIFNVKFFLEELGNLCINMRCINFVWIWLWESIFNWWNEKKKIKIYSNTKICPFLYNGIYNSWTNHSALGIYFAQRSLIFKSNTQQVAETKF